MWVVLKSVGFGAEMCIQTWKLTLTANARSDHHWQTHIFHIFHATSSHHSMLHLLSRRRPSSHGTRYAGLAASELLGSLNRISGHQLSRSEPTVVTYSPDLNPLHYHVQVAMLEKYCKLQLKSKTIDELKVALQTIWEELPQEHIDKAVANFTKRFITSSISSKSPCILAPKTGFFQSHQHTT